MIIQPMLKKFQKKQPLESYTWEEIGQIADKGDAEKAFEPYSTKDIQLTGKYNETITVGIADFEHDELVSGGKAPMTFVMKSPMNEEAQMNTSGTNVGGYKSTKMHTNTLLEILECFPSDLKNMIKTVNKPTGLGGGSTEGTEDVGCKLFLLSEEELFGEKKNSVGGEGEQYSMFVDEKVPSGTLWTRSPLSGSDRHFCQTFYSSSSYAPADGESSILFGFCI